MKAILVTVEVAIVVMGARIEFRVRIRVKLEVCCSDLFLMAMMEKG